MSILDRALARLFPSVPPAQQARLLAAMEARTMTPAPGARGEARPGAGTLSAPTFQGADQPEGEVTAPAARHRGSEHRDASPSGPPAIETCLSWQPHPSHADEFTDAWLNHLLDRWKGPTT